MITQTPKPPYYAVIFTSIRTDKGEKEYAKTAELMLNLAKHQSGFLGEESARKTVGITVSYWKDLESIKAWKQQTDHKLAQQKGRTDWYKQYKTRICKVERDYEFES
ncbi:MAG: antibiotic biosynthesis monooxygenase [Flavobacteriaceae bacterium]|nr:antibiotic biosynthesis monooxygenase [Flavobacteriaceae bacterium]